MNGFPKITMLLALALSLIWRAAPALAQTPPPPPPTTPSASTPPTSSPTPAAIAVSSDEADRITVPVMINDQGPFAFVVDTGADRTVISRELAAQLGLPPGPPAMLNATSGAELEQTAIIKTLKVGQRTIGDIDAPLLDKANIGALGMLGIDSLKSQSVGLDFRRRRITVTASRRDVDEPGVVVVYAKSRYGQLILVDAHIGRIPIYVILDSGSQNTVANTTLERMLDLHSPHGTPRTPVEVISVTGGGTPGEFMILPTATLGGVTLHNLPVAFADLHTFARFGLTQRPAMLLGIDVLRVFESVSIDFGRKTVSFHLP